MANAVGINPLNATAHQLGLGELSGLGLPAESAGVISSPAWLEKSDPSAKWTTSYTVKVGIGQGATLTTSLQMARLAAAIANGGRVLVPRLRNDGLPRLRTDLAEAGYTPQDLALLRASMGDIVLRGMGKAARSGLISIAGQTATTELSRVEGARRFTEPLGWFIGYAPAEAPRYAFAILVEGGEAGSLAAPIARRIMEALVKDRPVPDPQPPMGGSLRAVKKVVSRPIILNESPFGVSFAEPGLSDIGAGAPYILCGAQILRPASLHPRRSREPRSIFEPPFTRR